MKDIGKKKKIKVSLNPAREENESFKAYKIRRYCSNLTLKKYFKGRIIWNSATFEEKVTKLKNNINSITWVKVQKQGQRIGSFSKND